MAGGQGCSSPDRLPRGERGESRGAEPRWARAKPAQVFGRLYFWPFGQMCLVRYPESFPLSEDERTLVRSRANLGENAVVFVIDALPFTFR